MMSAAPSTPPELGRQQVVAWRNGLFAIFSMCGVGIASLLARLPAIKETLGLDTAQIGVLIFGVSLGSICGLLASSHLLDRFGARRVMAWCLGLAPLGLAGAGYGVSVVAHVVVVFIGLALFGMGLAICDVAMNLSGAVNERALGRTVMPIFHAFFSFGTMIGAGLGAVAEFASIPISVQTAVVGVAMIVVGLLGVRATQSERVTPADASEVHARPGWRQRVGVWRDRRTLLIGLIVLGMAFTEGSANDWLALAMVEGHGFDKPAGALIFGVFVTAMTIGRLVGVRVLDTFGRVPVLRASAAVAVVGLCVVIFVPNPWVAIGGVVLWGLGASLGFPTGMSAAADDPRMAAARVSAVATIGYLAFLVGPPLIGFLGVHIGILHALVVVLALLALSGTLSHAAREPKGHANRCGRS